MIPTALAKDTMVNPPSQSGPYAPVETAVGGSSILIVDDNSQNVELLEAYLEELDAEVRTAADGLEALAAVEKRQPDLVLLDVMMPRMSGYQVCVKLKGNPATRDIPIIMVTALGEIADVERAAESEANDFLTKPVNKLELVTRVRSLLKVRLMKRQLDAAMEQIRNLKAKDSE
jgi:two-component system, OmpR family, alkaline phosphatase synthesis response regulator PhoP